LVSSYVRIQARFGDGNRAIPVLKHLLATPVLLRLILISTSSGAIRASKNFAKRSSCESAVREVPGNHRGQSQQSRMQLGLRLSH
jgi:hypothetical protein